MKPRYSYPFTASWYVVAQATFFLQHLPLVLALGTLASLPAVRRERWAHRGLVAATVGFALLALMELVAMSAANATNDSTRSGRRSTASTASPCSRSESASWWRRETISTKAPGCAAATPMVTPDPLPAPPPPRLRRRRRRPARGRPAPAPAPRAIADFTTLPAASQCVRNRKLTLRMKRPPKGYTVKTVTVKVNAKRVATLKTKALKKPFYLRKLPRGTFTVTISIKLTKGKGLTERRRYTACK